VLAVTPIEVAVAVLVLNIRFVLETVLTPLPEGVPVVRVL
jgi:hypothetical protein